jgi:hypothetical protein
MWTFWAALGRPGTSSLASWVECMIEPSGLRILMGLVARRWLMTGELVLKKLLVLPVSTMIEEIGSDGLQERWRMKFIFY